MNDPDKRYNEFKEEFEEKKREMENRFNRVWYSITMLLYLLLSGLIGLIVYLVFKYLL